MQDDILEIILDHSLVISQTEWRQRRARAWSAHLAFCASHHLQAKEHCLWFEDESFHAAVLRLLLICKHAHGHIDMDACVWKSILHIRFPHALVLNIFTYTHKDLYWMSRRALEQYHYYRSTTTLKVSSTNIIPLEADSFLVTAQLECGEDKITPLAHTANACRSEILHADLVQTADSPHHPPTQTPPTQTPVPGRGAIEYYVFLTSLKTRSMVVLQSASTSHMPTDNESTVVFRSRTPYVIINHGHNEYKLEMRFAGAIQSGVQMKGYYRDRIQMPLHEDIVIRALDSFCHM